MPRIYDSNRLEPESPNCNGPWTSFYWPGQLQRIIQKWFKIKYSKYFCLFLLRLSRSLLQYIFYKTKNRECGYTHRMVSKGFLIFFIWPSSKIILRLQGIMETYRQESYKICITINEFIPPEINRLHYIITLSRCYRNVFHRNISNI